MIYELIKIIDMVMYLYDILFKVNIMIIMINVGIFW